MSFTPGEMLFYGGIAGMAIAAVVSAVVTAVLAGNRRRLRRKLDEEDGAE
jgi:hypothetical protein